MMSEQTQQGDLLGALEAALSEQAGAEAYRRSQRQVRRAGRRTPDSPGPLEFDANGFPISQRSPSFAARVARLLNP
jgi:hypothetical protein